MSEQLIPKEMGDRVLMVGVYYKNNAPGGMAAVIQYYAKYFERLRYFSSWRLTSKPMRLLYGLSAYFGVLWNLVIDRRIRILHVHTAADASFWRKSMFVKMGKCFGKNVIFHVHASRFKDFYNESSRQDEIVSNIRLADKLVVLSESWKEWFMGIGVDAEKIVVLHNITDYPVLTEKKMSDGKVHFLFLGEIGQRKGVFDILRGLAKHREELKDRIVLKIGGNRNEEQLLSVINDNRLQDFVKFEGWVAGEKKRELLNWADVFVLPSFNEGLPISILEAMSYGCPIISTPVGGIPEVVRTGENGVIVTPGNEEDIVAAMKKYIDTPGLLDKEGTCSKNMVKTYLPDFVLDHLKRIYEELLGQ